MIYFVTAGARFYLLTLTFLKQRKHIFFKTAPNKNNFVIHNALNIFLWSSEPFFAFSKSAFSSRSSSLKKHWCAMRWFLCASVNPFSLLQHRHLFMVIGCPLRKKTLLPFALNSMFFGEPSFPNFLIHVKQLTVSQTKLLTFGVWRRAAGDLEVEQRSESILAYSWRGWFEKKTFVDFHQDRELGIPCAYSEIIRVSLSWEAWGTYGCFWYTPISV